MGEKKPAPLNLIPVLLSALVIRLSFQTWVNDIDGYTYLRLAWKWAQGGFSPSLTGVERRFGVYAPLSLLYKLFGFHESLAILYPLLFSLLSILFIYGITRLLAGDKAALFAAWLWAFFPLDITLSHYLLPDALMVTYQTGAFLLFVWLRQSARQGTQARGRLWLGGLLLGLLLVWGFWVKEYSIYTAGFLLLFLLGEQLWQRWGRAWQAFFAVPLRRHLGLAAAALLLLAALLVYGSLQPYSFLRMLASTAQDTAALLLAGNPFFLFFPLFFVAALLALATRNKAVYLPLGWSAFLFLAHEWGTKNYNPLVYTPANFTDAARNLLFLFPGLVIAAGAMLARRPLRAASLRLLTWGGLGVSLLLGAAYAFLPGALPRLYALGGWGVLLFLLLSVLLLLLPLRHQPAAADTWLYGSLMLALLLAVFYLQSYTASLSDYVTLPYQNYRTAAHYLQAQPDAADTTLYTFSQPLDVPRSILSYHSGYRLRVVYTTPEELPHLKGGYLLVNQSLPEGALPAGWQPLARISQPPTANYTHPPVFDLYRIP